MLGYRANLHVTVAAQKMQTPVITSTGPNQSHSLAAKSTRTRMQSGQLRGAPSTVHTPLPDPAWPPDAPRWGVVLLLHQGWRFLPSYVPWTSQGQNGTAFEGRSTGNAASALFLKLRQKQHSPCCKGTLLGFCQRTAIARHCSRDKHSNSHIAPRCLKCFPHVALKPPPPPLWNMKGGEASYPESLAAA